MSCNNVGSWPDTHLPCLFTCILPATLRSAYSVLIIIMGSSCSRCGCGDDELPKPPVRQQPSDTEAKVKLAQNLGSVPQPDGTEREQEAIHVPVSERVVCKSH